MGSCFEEFIVRNTMVQSDFNQDTCSRRYDFCLLSKHKGYADVSIFGFICMLLLGWLPCAKIGPENNWIRPMLQLARGIELFSLGGGVGSGIRLLSLRSRPSRWAQLSVVDRLLRRPSSGEAPTQRWRQHAIACTVAHAPDGRADGMQSRKMNSEEAN
jgi:hypothetical protein